jgi:hypothetical protein
MLELLNISCRIHPDIKTFENLTEREREGEREEKLGGVVVANTTFNGARKAKFSPEFEGFETLYEHQKDGKNPQMAALTDRT